MLNLFFSPNLSLKVSKSLIFSKLICIYRSWNFKSSDKIYESKNYTYESSENPWNETKPHHNKCDEDSSSYCSHDMECRGTDANR